MLTSTLFIQNRSIPTATLRSSFQTDEAHVLDHRPACVHRVMPPSWPSVEKTGREEGGSWEMTLSSDSNGELQVNNSWVVGYTLLPGSADGGMNRLWHLPPSAQLGLPTHYVWLICSPANTRARRLVHDGSWKFPPRKRSQSLGRIFLQPPSSRFLPIKYRAFLSPSPNPK